MKDLIISIIAKIIRYYKQISKKVSSNLKFEGSKNGIIGAMYNPLLQNKKAEINKLLSELNNLKNETNKIYIQSSNIRRENELYKMKINAINSFQVFMLYKHL